MPTVKFVNEKKEVEVPEGTSVRAAALQVGINVHQGLNGIGAGINSVINCHGLGQCGTCRVLITKGIENASPMAMMEKAKFAVPVPDPLPCFAYIGNEDTMRLSCSAKVMGDMEVVTGPELNLFGENFFS
ncbi:MAG: ferredoxin [Blastopirellula sp.]|nr:MAG: ferredoxin [Blastopirellula sp.]